MTARIISKKQESKTSSAHAIDGNQPAEVIRQIKFELEKSGSEAYFIGKRVEDALAQVYFPSVF